MTSPKDTTIQVKEDSATSSASLRGEQATGDRREEIVAVIEMLERASGPARALDCKIWLVLFDKQIMIDGGGYSPNAKPPKYESARKIWTADWPHWGDRSQVDHGVAMEIGAPHYTASIDAALSLVPEGWFVANLAQWRSGAPTRTWAATLKLDPQCDEERHTSNRPSAAIALCIAALKARLAAITTERSPDTTSPSNGR